MIAAAGSAAAPGYAIANVQRLALTDLGPAAPDERVISVATLIASGTDLDAAMAHTDATVTQALDLPGFERIHDVRVVGSSGRARAVLSYRDGVCDRLLIVGTCPAAPGEAIMDAGYA